MPVGAYLSRVETLSLVTARFRLQEILDSRDPAVSQSELSRHSGVSLTTINRMANNLTAQVSLRTLDSLSAALTELTGRRVEPGDLIVREKGKRG
jgi:DNA-binding Xre family transcriptional regulator